MDDKLNLSQKGDAATKKANAILGCININIVSRSREIIEPLYSPCVQFWAPEFNKNIDKLGLLILPTKVVASPCFVVGLALLTRAHSTRLIVTTRAVLTIGLSGASCHSTSFSGAPSESLGPRSGVRGSCAAKQSRFCWRLHRRLFCCGCQATWLCRHHRPKGRGYERALLPTLAGGVLLPPASRSLGPASCMVCHSSSLPASSDLGSLTCHQPPGPCCTV